MNKRLGRRLVFALPVLVAGAITLWGWNSQSDESPYGPQWAVDTTRPPAAARYDSPPQPRLISITQLRVDEPFHAYKPVVGADHLGNVMIASQISRDEPLLSEIVTWHSTDFGNSWSPSRLLTAQPSRGGIAHHFDPWLEIDRRGRFYLSYARITSHEDHSRDYTPVMRGSRDGGANWSDPVGVGTDPADRPVFGISPNGERLVMAAASIEGDWPAGQTTHVTRVFTSTDHGVSWRRAIDPIRGKHAIAYSATIDDAGRIAAAWVEDCRSFLCLSTDGGETWTQRTLVPRLSETRPHCFNGGHFAVVAVDDRSRLHVAHLTKEGGALMFQTTEDWQRWEAPRALSDPAADEAAFAAVDTWGSRVHVAWMERRGELWNMYYRVSVDRGTSWSEPLQLEGYPAASDFKLQPDEQVCVTDDGLGSAHVVWTNLNGHVLHAKVRVSAVEP